MLGWTGGQYSILRVGLAGCVASVALARWPIVEGAPAALLLLILVLAFLLAVGWRGLAVTLNLIALLVLVVGPIDGAPLVMPLPDLVWTLVGLGLHATVPTDPYGAWETRGRIDPRGGWQRPVWSMQLARAALAILLTLRAALTPTATSGWAPGLAALAGPATAVAAIAFALAPRGSSWAPRLFTVLVLWQIACMAAFGFTPGDGALLLLHLFAVDPGWWPGRSLAIARAPDTATASETPARLFYDGDCGFCHNSVRLILSEEAATPEPLRLRFAPLAGPTFEDALRGHEETPPEALPDSIVLVLEDGRLLTRASAALEIAARLGGFWLAIATIGHRLPLTLLDRLYDGVARIRKRLVAKPSDACPILPPDLRARFDA